MYEIQVTKKLKLLSISISSLKALYSPTSQTEKS